MELFNINNHIQLVIYLNNLHLLRDAGRQRAYREGSHGRHDFDVHNAFIDIKTTLAVGAHLPGEDKAAHYFSITGGSPATFSVHLRRHNQPEICTCGAPTPDWMHQLWFCPDNPTAPDADLWIDALAGPPCLFLRGILPVGHAWSLGGGRVHADYLRLVRYLLEQRKHWWRKNQHIEHLDRAPPATPVAAAPVASGPLPAAAAAPLPAAAVAPAAPPLRDDNQHAAPVGAHQWEVHPPPPAKAYGLKCRACGRVAKRSQLTTYNVQGCLGRPLSHAEKITRTIHDRAAWRHNFHTEAEATLGEQHAPAQRPDRPALPVPEWAAAIDPTSHELILCDGGLSFGCVKCGRHTRARWKAQLHYKNCAGRPDAHNIRYQQHLQAWRARIDWQPTTPAPPLDD